ncbi:MAG: MBL fold metallo-hydrolase, partial [Pseudomonadota bacterium]
MTRLLPRRTVLQGIVGGVGAYVLPPEARAASAVSPTALTANMNMLTLGGVNVVVVTTTMGVVLVDTGPKEQAPALIEQLQAISPSYKYTLFITHSHADQIGAELVFRRMNSPIFAHRTNPPRPSINGYWPVDDPYLNALATQVEPASPYYTDNWSAGEEQIDYGFLPPGHTNEDMYVHFLNSNVLAVGDMVSPERDPELDRSKGGWLGGRVQAMDMLLARCNDTVRIIPSYGPVIGKPELQLERDMMAGLYTKLDEQVRMGFTALDSLNSGIMNGWPRT